MSKVSIPHEAIGSEGKMPYADIHNTFANSAYGKILEQEVRFGQYRHTPADHWKALLGPDVCNLQHAWLVYNRTRAFLSLALQKDPSAYSFDEQEKLLLTALCHDWGEVVVKDHEYGSKTHEKERREVAAIHRFAGELLPDPAIRDKMHWVADHIVDGKVDRREAMKSNSYIGTQLQESFEAIEQLDFTRTPLRAWDVHRSMSRRDHPVQRAALRSMGHTIVSAHIPILTHYAEDFTAVHHYLLAWRAHIQKVIDDDTETVLREYPLKKDTFTPETAKNVRRLWEGWLEENG
ncbi:hypothetical protein COU77_02530 [Candidatus Peregrinibacteria bacterium CG10_big_fil_rev_8_21_14_0_10_49_16]|nr:MAG: hypothetical protein COW95_01000 [Candidatus Peregrinibacteria bacterium CG22_combo_CG10-13_8_21_14_all_49_11]PIR52049.1 MAG: hypothetical protein COU77_02530 [Candidatus Peregrinibacteria bacterium CG10_big_fil_rev_8_21_14_0_10_49_16]